MEAPYGEIRDFRRDAFGREFPLNSSRYKKHQKTKNDGQVLFFLNLKFYGNPSSGSDATRVFARLGISFQKTKLIIHSLNKTQSLKLQKYFISGLNKIINEYKI